MAKLRHSRLHSKKWSTFTLVLSMLFMLSVVLLMLLGFGIFSLPVSTDDFTPNGLSASNRRMAVERDGHGLGKREEQWTEIVSWEPRAFLYHNFLVSFPKPVRTSSGMFLRRGQDKIIRSIEKRIADFSFIPADHGEGLQILHYEIGQKYEPHFDYFLDEFNTKNGGQRTATLLMYLSDVEEGGETVFPSAKANASSVPWWNELSECGKKGLSLKPKRGNALLFWSTRPDASLDPTSLHGSCPVIIGNKWSATKWMHLGEYKVS
ncbi:Probable prolyl 4-hydroxylase 3 [Linum perenne]